MRDLTHIIQYLIEVRIHSTIQGELNTGIHNNLENWNQLLSVLSTPFELQPTGMDNIAPLKQAS